MFSVQTQYGIKALAYLAKYQTKKKYILSAEIAHAFNLSKQFLDKTLEKFRKAKILESKIGKNGGYSLIKSSKTLSLFDIIAITENNFHFLKCLQNNPDTCDTCTNHETCSISKMILPIQNEFFNNLKNIYLNQVQLNNSDIQNPVIEAIDFQI